MKKRILSLLVVLGVAIGAHAYEEIRGVLQDSRIYPGTTHSYSVSVPESYDASAPACLYVGLDGPLYHAPAVIDSLIQAGAMPMTIGVYFQPGVLKDSLGNVIRYNRSNEYDAVDGRLAEFIETELLPEVRRRTTAAGLPLLITDNPDGRAISGASSGGIGAFVVAWQRPDLFRRVYTACGTYVAMRGGDQLAAVVRKTEPLPLRLFLQDGSNDAWNPLFGHWFEQNLLLASSLEFAGYDLQTRWDDSGHSIVPGARLFPEAMTWLWRDYPAPLLPRKSSNNCLEWVLDTDSGWCQADTMPQAAPADPIPYPTGTYTIRHLPGSQWLQTATAQAPDIWQNTYLLHDFSFTDPDIAGMAFDSKGNLYVATNMGIQIADQNGRVRAILRYPFAGKPEAFAFEGNTLYVDFGDRIYRRTIGAEAAGAAPVEVESQGPS